MNAGRGGIAGGITADATLFFKAIAAGELATIQKMVEQGFDLKSVNEKGENIFQAVATTKHVEILAFFLTTSARNFLNEGFGHEMSARASSPRLFPSLSPPLHQAVKAGQFKMVSALIAAGADLYAVDEEGLTALHAAIFLPEHQQAVKMIDLLVKNGLRPEKLRSRMDEPILFALLRRKEPRLLDYMLARFPLDMEEECPRHKRKAMHTAVMMHDLKLLNCLLKHGAKLDSRDRYGSTPLHYAVQQHMVQMAAFLVEKGADPLLKNKRQVTPHELAFIHGNIQLRAVFNKTAKAEKPRKKKPYWRDDKAPRSLRDKRGGLKT
jgi:ankyrin repeat protein